MNAPPLVLGGISPVVAYLRLSMTVYVRLVNVWIPLCRAILGLQFCRIRSTQRSGLKVWRRRLFRVEHCQMNECLLKISLPSLVFMLLGIILPSYGYFLDLRCHTMSMISIEIVQGRGVNSHLELLSAAVPVNRYRVLHLRSSAYNCPPQILQSVMSVHSL